MNNHRIIKYLLEMERFDKLHGILALKYTQSSEQCNFRSISLII